MKKLLFETRTGLDKQLADDILTALQEARTNKGWASILFSGGSTPKGLLSQLAESEFDWTGIRVGLVDDRMVPANHEASNANLLNRSFFSLIKGNKPSFHPLVEAEPESGDSDQAMASAKAIGTPDVVVLGMGTDGHFASLFPGDDASQQGLDRNYEDPVLYTQAPVEPRYRVSHSWSYLRRAKHHFLHITGDLKLDIIERYNQRNEALPIDSVLSDDEVETVLYWAP